MLRVKVSDDPSTVRWNLSPVSLTEMLTRYSVMSPLRVSSEGALQVRVRVRESTGVARIAKGTSLGTANETRDTLYLS